MSEKKNKILKDHNKHLEYAKKYIDNYIGALDNILIRAHKKELDREKEITLYLGNHKFSPPENDFEI